MKFDEYSERLGELIANTVSHGVGVLLGIAALVLMIVKADELVHVLSVIPFGITLILLYLSSTLYHAFPMKMTRVRAVFKRFDHASIFLLIAGTYTPFMIILADSTRGYILLSTLWSVTIIGVVMKSIWVRKYQLVHLILYLIMGWSIVFVWPEISPHLDGILIWLILGGASYTAGVIFYISRFRYSHFIWHLFVLGGSIFHFFAVLALL
jgi:hemolysin III